jgi:TonB family protein
MRSINLLAPVALLALHGAANAQYRCDCTSVVDTCNATVEARATWLEVKTDRAQCARVDYFVDGQPFVSLVVDGEDRQNWLARTTNPRILVQSCQVCATGGAAPPTRSTASPAPTSAAREDDDRLRPMIAGVPEYPRAAGGVRGHVDVEFTVTPAGTVENAHVVASEPRGVFDAAALASVRRWRFQEDQAREPTTLTERVSFEPPAGQVVATGTGPRNQCIREDAVYNYGESVDVGLINACAEPLLVYGCAQGTGRDLGRWTCSDSEQRAAVLVAVGDRRVGSRYPGASATGDYTYAESFDLMRAPNTELWWLACRVDDAQCRADARQWVRAMSGQLASVDPQGRSPLTVARSY